MLCSLNRVKLTLFARDSESGSDLTASEIVEMINSGKAEGLEQYGFKVESASTSKYFSFFFLLYFLFLIIFVNENWVCAAPKNMGLRADLV